MPRRLRDDATNAVDVPPLVELRLSRVEAREEEELAHRARQHEAIVRVEIGGVGLAGPDLVPERECVAGEVEAGRRERRRCRHRGRRGRQRAGARGREHQNPDQRAADENPQA